MELPADLTLYIGKDSVPFMNIVDKNFNGTLDWNSLVRKFLKIELLLVLQLVRLLVMT